MEEIIIKKRGRGRPKGSTNKKKKALFETVSPPNFQDNQLNPPLDLSMQINPIDTLPESQKQIIEADRITQKIEAKSNFSKEEKKDPANSFLSHLNKTINELFQYYKELPIEMDIQEELIWAKINTLKIMTKKFIELFNVD